MDEVVGSQNDGACDYLTVLTDIIKLDTEPSTAAVS